MSDPAKATDDPAKLLRDAAYVGIGFGVLTFQKAQVRRQELNKSLSALAQDARASAERVGTTIESGYAEVERRVDGALDDLEKRLPHDAAQVVHAARTTARSAQEQWRSAVRGERTSSAA